MKKFSFLFILCLISLLSFNVFALDLDNIIKKDENGQVEISSESLSKDIGDDISKQLKEEVQKVSKEIDNKVNELKAKADEEMAKVSKIIDEAEKEFNLIKQLRSKIRSYILMAYFAVGALGVLLIILILVLIKLWLKVSRIGKITYMFKTIRDLDERIKRLENKVAKL